MKPLFLATAALAIAGAGTLQAADIFTCSGLGYAAHNGRVELDCTDPVTTHWTKLGGHSAALVCYIDEPDGLHVAVTTQQGMKEKAPVERFQMVLPPGQSAAVSIPRAAGRGAGANRAQQRRGPPAYRRASRCRFCPVTSEWGPEEARDIQYLFFANPL